MTSIDEVRNKKLPTIALTTYPLGNSREENQMRHAGSDPQSPIVQHFKIIGLHGYKNISLDFKTRARIAIAENGSGKTTFLSALSAFIQADFDKLRGLHYQSIECKFSGQAALLVLLR